MNVLQLARILKAQGWLIVGATIICVLLSVGWGLLRPRGYTAVSQVLIGIREPDTVGDQVPVAQLQPDYLATQADVIRSDRVAERAAEKLGLGQDPRALAEYRQAGSADTPIKYYARLLQKGLTVVPSTTSRVISVEFESAEPEQAARGANAFAEAFRDVTLDLQVEPARQAASWYDNKAAELSRRLMAAQSKLFKRSAELGVTADRDETDSELTRLNQLASQLAAAQASQATASARTGSGALPDAMSSPVIQSLQADLARLEAQRQQLATFAGPQNIDYKQISNQVEALRGQLASQRALIARSAGASAAQSASNVGQLSGAVAAQKERVTAARAARGEVLALQQDVDNLKRTYEQLVAKRSQVELLGSGVQTNVAVLARASVPQHPSGTPLPMRAVAGLLVGLIIGVVLALIREFLDQRVRSPEDAELWLGIPNLGGVRQIKHRTALIGGGATRYLPPQIGASAS